MHALDEAIEALADVGLCLEHLAVPVLMINNEICMVSILLIERRVV